MPNSVLVRLTFIGAYLLSDNDELARSVLTAQHCDLIDRERTGEFIRTGGKAVQRVYQLPRSSRIEKKRQVRPQDQSRWFQEKLVVCELDKLRAAIAV